MSNTVDTISSGTKNALEDVGDALEDVGSDIGAFFKDPTVQQCLLDTSLVAGTAALDEEDDFDLFELDDEDLALY